MRRLALAALLAALPATAQVTVDPEAIAPTPRPAKPAPRKPEPAKPPKPRVPAPKPTAAPTPPAPPVPAAPPAGPVLPPPIEVPLRPTPPPQPVTVTPDAPGETTPIPGGIRITFGPGRSDLNPASDQALRRLAHATQTDLTVTSFAAGTQDDPSTPRRISLSRALAARAVLITEGVLSTRIFVRALGPTSPGFADGPPDRVDISAASAPRSSSETAPDKTPAP